MLTDCGLGTTLVRDMKRGQMPSADKLIIIAQYLEVSAEYLMGVTDDPTPPKKELTLDEQVAAEYYIMTPDEREQLKEYMEFLKTKKPRQTKSISGQTEISSELQPNL